MDHSKYAISLVNFKVWQLITYYDFNAFDREDLIQEMLIELFLHLPKFNPKRSKISTFINLIITTKTLRLIKYHKCCGRNYVKPDCYLNEEIEKDIAYENGIIEIEKMNMILANEIDAAKMPKELCEIYNWLKYDNVADISRKTGIPRRTIYRKIKRIIKILKKQN
ncbi:MAG: sigma-70 family RNA polymerase sigma factor [Desulfobacterales bacterium]|nr:sigma-70 family RNA polymerase sigma factor [Desulfobacterales bacterium]